MLAVKELDVKELDVQAAPWELSRGTRNTLQQLQLLPVIYVVHSA